MLNIEAPGFPRAPDSLRRTLSYFVSRVSISASHPQYGVMSFGIVSLLMRIEEATVQSFL